jgi:hypothetical protein
LRENVKDVEPYILLNLLNVVVFNVFFIFIDKKILPASLDLTTKSLPKPIIYNINCNTLHHPVEQRTRKTEVQNKQFMKVIFQVVHSL